MNAPSKRRPVAAPRTTAILGLILAVSILAQGLFAGGFMQGDHKWLAWHEALGNALVLPPLISLVVALLLIRRQPDPPSALTTRVFLLVLVLVVILTGHAGRDLLMVHIPAAIAVVGISVRQATGFMRVVHLRREFENFSPALKTVASRLSRGAYKHGGRTSEPSITDDRGRLIRSVGKTQTFLSVAQVDELIVLYGEGLSVAEVSRKFGIYTRTAVAHLVRRSVPLRQRGLATADTPEAVRLYEGGLTLMEVGMRFGVSQQAIRRAVAAAGAEIRPRGRRPQPTA